LLRNGAAAGGEPAPGYVAFHGLPHAVEIEPVVVQNMLSSATTTALRKWGEMYERGFQLC
jgi:hypothetical protein